MHHQALAFPALSAGLASQDLKADSSAGAKSAAKALLLAQLDIDPSVLQSTLESSDKGIRTSYLKYQSHLQADSTLKQKILDGTWVGRKPTATELIELFVSKSMWHSHYSLFGQVSNYPLLKKWLDNETDAPGDFEVWGYEKLSYNFKDMKDYMRDSMRNTATEVGTSSSLVRDSKKSKGKGKEKEKEKEKKTDKSKKDKKSSSSKKKAK